MYIRGKQTHCIARSNYTRATSPLTACGPLALFKECGSMELTNGLAGMSSSMERPKKISMLSKAKQRKHKRYTRGTQEVHDHIVTMYQTGQQRVRPIDSHVFDMPLARRLEQSLNRKQLWVESVTIAYKSWQTLQVIQEPNQQ